MKSITLKLITALALAVPAFAAEKDHERKPKGPNGGRVVTDVKPPLEILVTKHRKIEITALTADYKPGKLSGQVVSATAGDRGKPTKIEFKEEGGKLVSTGALPEGSGYPVSVSIKADANAKTVYEKFNLNLSKCPECKLSEYACICGHEEQKEE
jgi:hypothetical protein